MTVEEYLIPFLFSTSIAGIVQPFSSTRRAENFSGDTFSNKVHFSVGFFVGSAQFAIQDII